MTPKTSAPRLEGRPGPSHAATGPGRQHKFVPYPMERYASCVRCGRPRHDPVHIEQPELRRATLITHLERAVQRVREGDEGSALLEAEVAVRILKEEA